MLKETCFCLANDDLIVSASTSINSPDAMMRREIWPIGFRSADTYLPRDAPKVTEMRSRSELSMEVPDAIGLLATQYFSF